MLQGVIRGDKGVTKGYTGLQGVKGGYKGLHGGYKGLKGVAKDYRIFFLTRRFSGTFSWSLLHKNQR